MPVVVTHLLSHVIAQLMGNFALCPGNNNLSRHLNRKWHILK